MLCNTTLENQERKFCEVGKAFVNATLWEKFRKTNVTL